jgi:phospholipid/cholesterol/gamma-HCH transport system substrate-binding protein
MRWVSRLTTIFVVVLVLAGLALFVRSRLPETATGGDFHTYVLFRDGSRLQVGSPVVIAGVPVGVISGMRIQGRFARVDLHLQDDVKLPVGTFATRRADSLFGDSYIELVPSGDDPTMLASGEPIRNVQDGGSTDAALRAIARTMPKIDNALEAMHRFMIDGRRWVNGALSEGVQGVERYVASDLEGPLAAADRAMATFEEGTVAAAAAIAEAAPSIDGRFADIDRSVTTARTRMRDARESLESALADARVRFDDVDAPISDVAELVAAIDEGRGDDWKGSLGRMIEDPLFANSLEDFSGDFRDGFSGRTGFRAWLGGRMEVGLRSGDVRTYAHAELYTRTDKFYLVEFSYSPLGALPASDLRDAPGNPQFTRTQEIGDNFRFTAQFGKRFGFAQGRIGLKDSTPGIGADALFFNGRLKLSSDVFGGFDRAPRLKLAGAFAVFRSIYILAGVDDVLTTPGSLPIITGNTPVPTVFQELRYGRDVFLGASLHFTDADLATILRFYGALLVGYVVR